MSFVTEHKRKWVSDEEAQGDDNGEDNGEDEDPPLLVLVGASDIVLGMEEFIPYLNEEETLSLFGVSFGTCYTSVGLSPKLKSATKNLEEEILNLTGQAASGGGGAATTKERPSSSKQIGSDEAEASRIGIGGPISESEEDLPKPGPTVKVFFIDPLSLFYEDVPDRKRATQISNSTNLPEMSLIRPVLSIHFFRQADQNMIKLTLHVEYEMGAQGHRWPGGWFQNNFQLSLRNVSPEASVYRQASGVVSPVESVETQTMLEHAASSQYQKAQSRDAAVHGGVEGFLSGNFEGGDKKGFSDQFTDTDQSKFQIRRNVVKKYSSFCLSNHSVGKILEFDASYWPALDPSSHFAERPWIDGRGSGLQSLFDLSVEGTWEVYGTDSEEYMVEASKRLSNVAGGEQTNVLQIFRAKFKINHQFNKFLHLHGKPSYHWRRFNEESPSPSPCCILCCR